MIRTLLVPVLLLSGLSAATAQVAVADAPARPFPLAVTADNGASGLDLAPKAKLLKSLAKLDRVTLSGVPLRGGVTVTAVLDRVDPQIQFIVDGVPADAADARTTVWAGRVVGEAGGEAFLAFSPYGSRGWIENGGETYHLLALPGRKGEWSTSTSQMVSAEQLAAEGYSPQTDCRTVDVPQPNALVEPVVQPSAAGGIAPLRPQIYDYPIAFETDEQFFDLFGDVPAAQAYLSALLGAIGNRYLEDVGVAISMPYVAIHTEDDPWQSQDLGGSCIDVLFEMKGAWEGGAGPVPAATYHMLSGAELGCGVAFLNTLCNPDWGFSVSGNMHGQTSLPIYRPNPLNWDFTVASHEIGHNVATPHTHDYCPPLDSCPPDFLWGACQSETVCGMGTIMSYCHICPNGLFNVVPEFHPVVRFVMRSAVLASCLPVIDPR